TRFSRDWSSDVCSSDLKSTLLKIMAGLDSEFTGEAKAAEGVKRGYLEQEPQLDDSLNVRENVEAWCEEKQWVNRFNAIAMEMARSEERRGGKARRWRGA